MATAQQLMAVVEQPHVKKDFEIFNVGDSVDVHLKIVEGEKERIQIFSGIVIGMKGSGTNRSFTVRRLVGTNGVERIFPLNCPSIDRIEVKKRGKIRRAKLYYLRGRLGKATRVTEILGAQLASTPETAEAVKPRAAGTAEPTPKKDKKDEKKK